LFFYEINNFTQYGERANHHFHLKLTKQQRERLVALTEASGFATMSGYFRFMLLNPSIDEKLNRILEIVNELWEKKKLIDLHIS